MLFIVVNAIDVLNAFIALAGVSLDLNAVAVGSVLKGCLAATVEQDVLFLSS